LLWVRKRAWVKYTNLRRIRMSVERLRAYCRRGYARVRRKAPRPIASEYLDARGIFVRIALIWSARSGAVRAGPLQIRGNWKLGLALIGLFGGFAFLVIQLIPYIIILAAGFYWAGKLFDLPGVKASFRLLVNLYCSGGGGLLVGGLSIVGKALKLVGNALHFVVENAIRLIQAPITLGASGLRLFGDGLKNFGSATHVKLLENIGRVTSSGSNTTLEYAKAVREGTAGIVGLAFQLPGQSLEIPAKARKDLCDSNGMLAQALDTLLSENPGVKAALKAGLSCQLAVRNNEFILRDPETNRPVWCLEEEYKNDFKDGEVPDWLITIYQEAAARYKVPWEVLAAINWNDTEYGNAGLVGEQTARDYVRDALGDLSLLQQGKLSIDNLLAKNRLPEAAIYQARGQRSYGPRRSVGLVAAVYAPLGDRERAARLLATNNPDDLPADDGKMKEFQRQAARSTIGLYFSWQLERGGEGKNRVGWIPFNKDEWDKYGVDSGNAAPYFNARVFEKSALQSVFDASPNAYCPIPLSQSGQAGSLPLNIPPNLPAKPPPHIYRAIVRATQKFGFDLNVALAVAYQESGFRTGLTSPAGAVGLFQTLPSTAASIGYGDVNRLLHDAEYSAEAGVKYLVSLAKQNKRLDLTLAAYNAGPGAVAAAGGVPPYAETLRYVENVVKWSGRPRNFNPLTAAGPGGMIGEVDFTFREDGEKDVCDPVDSIFALARFLSEHGMQGTIWYGGIGSAIESVVGRDSDVAGSLAERMVAIARKELRAGVKEEPPGSNNGPRIAEYRKAVAGNPGPGPWCVYFLSWVTARAGQPIGPGGTGLGSAAALLSWARSERLIVDKPKPGDILVTGNGSHAALVEDVKGDRFTTIDGNWSNRVARVQRNVNDRNISAFIRLELLSKDKGDRGSNKVRKAVGGDVGDTEETAAPPRSWMPLGIPSLNKRLDQIKDKDTIEWHGHFRDKKVNKSASDLTAVGICTTDNPQPSKYQLALFKAAASAFPGVDWRMVGALAYAGSQFGCSDSDRFALYNGDAAVDFRGDGYKQDDPVDASFSAARYLARFIGDTPTEVVRKIAGDDKRTLALLAFAARYMGIYDPDILHMAEDPASKAVAARDFIINRRLCPEAKTYAGCIAQLYQKIYRRYHDPKASTNESADAQGRCGDRLAPPATSAEPDTNARLVVDRTKPGKYVVLRPEKGAKAAVAATAAALEDFQRCYPSYRSNWRALQITAWNEPGHKSHRNGGDVDVAVVGATMSLPDYDREKAVTLATLFFQHGAYWIFYDDPYVQKKIAKMWRNPRPDERDDIARLKPNHWPNRPPLFSDVGTNHSDHFHVRWYNSLVPNATYAYPPPFLQTFH